MEAKSITVLEHAHIAEMQLALKRKLQESQKKDLGRRDSLARSILQMVVGESYDPAKKALEDYLEDRHQFPDFQTRASRYIRHCSELIHAVQTKRNFPGLASLSLSRQQEIHEKVLEHFEELKHNLKHVEKIERDHRLVDMRTTVWVIQAVCLSVLAVAAALFFIDLRSGVLSSLLYMSNLAIDHASNWIVNLLL